MPLITHDMPCVILCGGKSSRMGEDKALLPFSTSNSLTQHQYNRLKPYFKKIYISSKVDKFDFLEDKKSIILDKGEEYSPIVALESIVESLETDKFFIITVDTPLVKIETIERLIKETNEYDICVAKTSRVHNLCGVFSKTIKGVIKTMLSEDIHKVGFLLKNLNTKYIEFTNDDEFINLNDKEEYFKAKSIITSTNNYN